MWFSQNLIREETWPNSSSRQLEKKT